MKQPPSTRLVFSVVLLVLAGVAVAGGALQTLGETLGHSVQANSASAPIAMPPARERPASLAPMTEPRLPPVPERNNRLFDADYLLAARQALEQMPALAGHRLVNLRFAIADIRREADGRTYHALVRFRAVTEPSS